MLTIVFYTSGHGFGHATRDSAVIQEIQAAAPAARIVVRTSAPARLFPVSDRVLVQAVEVDPGAVQKGSLEVDVLATAHAARRFYTDFDRRARQEAAVLAELGAAVVVSDISPLAFEAAVAAGVPSVAFGNFTWDWIYAAYPEFDHAAPGVVERLRGAYSHATLALRLPFHGGFASVKSCIKDIGLVARRSALGRDEARRRLTLPGDRPIVLASFGGHTANVPYREAASQGELTLVITEHELPEHARTPLPDRLRTVTRPELQTLEMTYPDLVAAADAVISKPGYGIVSECIANGAALLYALRGRFAEQEVLLAELPRVLRCRELAAADLLAGHWGGAVRDLLAQAAPAGTLQLNGAATAAYEILAAATQSSAAH
jgi:predicted glycosyltransferase